MPEKMCVSACTTGPPLCTAIPLLRDHSSQMHKFLSGNKTGCCPAGHRGIDNMKQKRNVMLGLMLLKTAESYLGARSMVNCV